MKTKEIKVYLYAENAYGNPKVEVTSSEHAAKYCDSACGILRAPIAEIFIKVPDLSVNELEKILQGSLLESLIEERKELQAQTQLKINKLNQRIAELQCIEFKE